MKFIKSTRFLAGVAAIAMATSLATPGFAQDADTHLKAKKAKTFQGSALNSKASSNSAIADFIAEQNGQPGTGPNLIVDSTYNGKNGRTHMRLHQEVDGLRVHGSYVKAAAGADGKLVHLVERTTRGNGQKLKANISAETAISAAVAKNFGADKGAEFFHKAPSAEKVWIARDNGALEEGYLVENWSETDNRLYHTLVDGKGKVVDNELRTAEDSYNVYTDHPLAGPQTVVNGPGAGNAQSPSGWLSGPQTTRDIRGNNVSAYLDRDNNNGTDGGGTAVTDGNFLAQHFDTQSPLFSDNQDVAVQNLFYLNNLIHDDLYGHGFVEGTRNFQEDNFSNGGIGSDSVNAEAQDGGGTNNANFATPSDGSNPRMQMYIWTRTNPNRDGDLDSDIVWHEYGHGLTWRMIGSMSGSVSGAIGEGMGDVLGILHNNRDTIGTYSTNDPDGIRSAAYTNYPRTIGDFGGSSVHFDGEIYAATIWNLAELSNADGIDNEAVLDVVVDGMNFTPAGPDYLDMRDGILAAASPEYSCTVWQAFANYGMGEGSSFTIRTGGNPRNRIQITESFNIPASCDGGEPPAGSTVSGLSGSSAAAGRRNWVATATATISDDLGAAASGVVVGGSFSSGGSASCTTNVSGTCSITSSSLKNNRVSSTTFTINTLDGAAATGSPLSVSINRP